MTLAVGGALELRLVNAGCQQLRCTPPEYPATVRDIVAESSVCRDPKDGVVVLFSSGSGFGFEASAGSVSTRLGLGALLFAARGEWSAAAPTRRAEAEFAADPANAGSTVFELAVAGSSVCGSACLVTVTTRTSTASAR